MPNDFETHALQKLLGLNQEMVQPMIPDFLNTMSMLPGVSGPDEQLAAMTGLAPDIYASLAALLSPPEIEGSGVTPPQIQKTGLVRPQQQMQRPAAGAPRTQGTGRPNMDDERAKMQRRTQRAQAMREQQERQAKKKGTR